MKPSLIAGGLLLLASASPTAAPSPSRERIAVPCEVLNLRYDAARERWRAVPVPRTPAERNRVFRRFT